MSYFLTSNIIMSIIVMEEKRNNITGIMSKDKGRKCECSGFRKKNYEAQTMGKSLTDIKRKFFLTFFILSSTLILYAQPLIKNVVMNPPNPGFGQNFTVTITYCGQLYNSHNLVLAVSTKPIFQNAQLSGMGQIFLITNAGVNVPRASANPGSELGYVVRPAPGGSVTPDCNLCSGTGKQYTDSYSLTMPNENDFPGCNNTSLYLLASMHDANFNEGEWDNSPHETCAPNGSSGYISPAWTIPTPSSNFVLRKRSEGILQDLNDLVLFSIDYEYANGPLTITDTIPIPSNGQYTLVSVGPLGMWTGPALGTTFPPGSGTITWTLPNRTGMPGKASGSVWFLMRMTGATPMTAGTSIANTATGTMGSIVRSSTSTVVVGQAAISIGKSQSNSAPLYGSVITYMLEYNINGSKLVAYQPFDDLVSNTYNASTGPPPNWRFEPSGTESGSWYVYDECGTGDRIIRGTSPTQKYPQLLHDKGSSFCTGIIVSDVMIGANYEGADSMIIIRSNNKAGTAASVAYGIVLSVDNSIGTNSGGSLGFQRCNGNPASCIWPASTNPPMDIETNRWYRIKVEAVSDYQFRAKVWAKGDPEPAGWQLTWTDASPPAGSSCASDTWYTGIAQQGGDSGYTNDYYNNFLIYEPRTSASTTVYDTIPTCLTGVSGMNGPLGAPTISGGRITWNLGSLSNEGGTLTWWGTVNCCTRITNTASIAGAPPIVTQNSNPVYADPLCPALSSITKTASPGNVYLNDPITFTINYSNTGPYPISNYQIWDTIPNCIAVNSINNGGTQIGSIIVWNLGTLAANASGTVTWVGRATCYPENPYNAYKEFFAYIKDYFWKGRF